MKIEDLAKKLKDCFKDAEKDEKEGKKHKGLLVVESNDKSAREYIQKAKDALDWCNIYKQKGADYILEKREKLLKVHLIVWH